MRNFLLTTCMGALAVFATGTAHANDELIRMSQNPKDWVMPDRKLRQPSLLSAQADHRPKRREIEGGVDVFDGRSARP
jgi:hypothetical protein